MPHLALRALPLAAALILPLAAHAQSQLDRLEVLSEQMTEMTYTALIAEIPVLEGNLPSAEWDAPMREAGTCVLDAYRDEVGDAGVDTMLDGLETTVASATPDDILSGNLDMDLPDGLTDAQVQQINTDCGMVEIMMTRMAESGAMQIMMQNQ